MKKTMTIEITFAQPKKQILISLEVHSGCTIDGAIRRSDILKICPEIDLSSMSIGVWGERRRLTDIVSDGDRIEIYRPLAIDPKEARRKRAGLI